MSGNRKHACRDMTRAIAEGMVSETYLIKPRPSFRPGRMHIYGLTHSEGKTERERSDEGLTMRFCPFCGESVSSSEITSILTSFNNKE